MFQMRSVKSLEYDSNLHIFQFAANRSKNKSLGYKYIGIDKDNGPFYSRSTKTFNVDAKYRKYDKTNEHVTYSVALNTILDEHIPEIHECILYNKDQWGSKFNNWFEQNGIFIAPRFDQIGYIIYSSGKYIDITWIAPSDKLFAYKGYEKNVAVAGGKEIDASEIFDDFMNFKYVNNKEWYVDSDGKYEIVSKAGKSKIAKLHDILGHQQKSRSVNVLQTALRKANTSLKPSKYGSPYYYSTTLPTFVWKDYLKTQLKKFDIKTETYSNKAMWSMGRGVAKCIFQDKNIFSKQIDHPWHDIEIVASHLKLSLSLSSGRMIIRGIQLKHIDGETDGLAGLTRIGSDRFEDFHFSLFDMPTYALHEILIYLTSKDLLIVKNVSQELNILCCNTANGH